MKLKIGKLRPTVKRFDDVLFLQFDVMECKVKVVTRQVKGFGMLDDACFLRGIVLFPILRVGRNLKKRIKSEAPIFEYISRKYKKKGKYTRNVRRYAEYLYQVLVW